MKSDDSTDFGKILKIYETVPAFVVVSENLQYLCLLHVETQCPHRDFELMVVERSIFIGVEELKGLFYFLFLFVCKFWTRMSASLCFLCRGRVHRERVDGHWVSVVSEESTRSHDKP